MAERWATIPDWDEKQHYKKGRGQPPWIKFHVTLLSSRRFQMLPLASKALAPQLWLLATKNDGRVNVDLDELEFQLRWPRAEIEAGLKSLIDNAYIVFASNVLATCKQHAIPETETYREETETESEKKEAHVTRAREAVETVPRGTGQVIETALGEILDAWADLETAIGWREARVLPTCSPGDLMQIAHLRKAYGPQAWPEVMANIRAGPFYRGEEGQWSGARFGWVLREENFIRVLRNDHGEARKRTSTDDIDRAIVAGVAASR